MAEIDPNKLRERCEKRLSGMKRQREPWDPHWREISTFCQSTRSRWLNDDPSKGEAINTKGLNGKTIECVDILANGMASGLTSPSRPWFKLTTTDPDLKQFHDVKVWLGIVEARLAQLFHTTNFYPATQSGYRELALFGIEAAIMTQHWKHQAVVHPLTAGEYWIGISDALTPDSLYRRCPMTVAMAVQKFGNKVSSTVRDMYDRSDYDNWVPIFHAIEPNPERVPSKVDKSNMLFRSVYWEEKSDSGKDVLAFEGFEQQPFWAPRWDAGGGSPIYCKGPASNVLRTAKRLEIKELRLQRLEDYVVSPALVGPPQLQQAESNINPGGRTYLAQQDLAQFKPIWEPDPQAVGLLLRDIDRCESEVERLLYSPLFMAITTMEGVQPRNDTEIGQRIEEKMTQLGPVVERVEKEKLRVAIDIGFAILTKNRLVPPAPRELRGHELQIEFVSVLAQAQRAVGLGAIERTAGFVLNATRVAPESGDKFDWDKAVEEYSDISGSPAKLLRSDEDAALLRQRRAQQQQAMAAAAAAKPARDGAEALKALTQASGGGAVAPPRVPGSGSTVLENILASQAA